MRLFHLLLRLSIGGLFVGHGAQKLFGWFGGHGFKATAEGFDQMGLRPGKVNALAAGVTEAGGGALLATGFLTPMGAASIIASMLTAIHRVHLKNGIWVTDGGFEYPFVLIAAVLAVVEDGPGLLSLDAIKGQERKGTAWALAALAAGGAGAAAAYFGTAAVAPPSSPAQS